MVRSARSASALTALLLALPLPARGAGLARAEVPPPAASAEASPPPPVTGDPAPPSRPGAPPPLEPPRWRAALTFGASGSSGQASIRFGGLLGYEVASGFELFLDGQYWGGSQPSASRLAGGVNWYAPIPYRPYLGVYYAHWFVGGTQPDLNALGGRAGLTIASSPRAALGAGVVYERILDCASGCEAWWPELSVGFRF